MLLKPLIVLCCLGLMLTAPVARANESSLPPLEITLSNQEYAPYMGQAMPSYGLMSRVVSAAFLLENVKVNYVFYPNNRALQSALSGSVDGSLGWAVTPARKQRLLYTDPVMSLHMVFFQRASQHIPWHSLSDLHGYVIGVTAGNTYSDEFTRLQNNKRLDVEAVADDVTNFRKLLAHHIDLFPIDAEVGAMLLNRNFSSSERSQLVAQPRAFWSADMHVVIWRKHPEAAELVHRFNLGLAQLQRSGEFERLVEQTREDIDKQAIEP